MSAILTEPVEWNREHQMRSLNWPEDEGVIFYCSMILYGCEWSFLAPYADYPGRPDGGSHHGPEKATTDAARPVLAPIFRATLHGSGTGLAGIVINP